MVLMMQRECLIISRLIYKFSIDLLMLKVVILYMNFKIWLIILEGWIISVESWIMALKAMYKDNHMSKILKYEWFDSLERWRWLLIFIYVWSYGKYAITKVWDMVLLKH